MRINSYIASATGLSRRKADLLIESGLVYIDGKIAKIGMNVDEKNNITIDNQPIKINQKEMTLIINKPTGYVVSRNGQGARTIYDLLPEKYSTLKPVGRLDKDSSGLMLLTNNGLLANNLAHPSKHKVKNYQVKLNKPISEDDIKRINNGVTLNDGVSHIFIKKIDSKNQIMTINMSEGKNRQIRRTFAKLNYEVTYLHRTEFGEYKIGDLEPGEYQLC